ncbi:MAG: SAM-dependent methyltransferase [Acidimicrobiales bacterium]
MDEPAPGRIEPLPPDIDVVEGTEVSELWEQFRFYEAGHHRMEIMNPLSSAGLDRVLDELAVEPGRRVLDIACGHGDLLLRLLQRCEVDATGVDLSPWTIRRAHRRLRLARDSTPSTAIRPPLTSSGTSS